MSEEKEESEKRVSHKLAIHHLNIFNPKTPAIKCMALDQSNRYLAVSRLVSLNKSIPEHVTIIEIYKLHSDNSTGFIKSFYINEQVSELIWHDWKTLITVSLEQTIALYDLNETRPKASITTDYGPILCARYMIQDNLLITATQYGYIVTYKIIDGCSIVVDRKLIKVSKPITGLAVSSVGETRESIDPKQRKRQKIERRFLILGATECEVTVWDLERGNIVDTLKVCEGENHRVTSINNLKNSCVIVGDSTGTINLIDNKSLTMKQTLKVSELGIVSIAKDPDERSIMVTCQGPHIIHLRADHLNDGLLRMFEKTRPWRYPVNRIIFKNIDVYYLGCSDGTIVRCRVSREGKKQLYKDPKIPQYRDCIEFSDDEIMLRYTDYVAIWKFPKTNFKSIKNIMELSEEFQPKNTLSIKTKNFIYASTLSKKWICYSTKRYVHIYFRQGDRLIPIEMDTKIQNCHLLKVFNDEKHLAVFSGNEIHIFDLLLGEMEKNLEKNDYKHSSRIQNSLELDGSATCLINPDKTKLVVTVGPIRNHLYIIERQGETWAITNQASLKSLIVSRLATRKRDSIIYILTNSNQIVRYDHKKQEFVGGDLGDRRFSGFSRDNQVEGIVLLEGKNNVLAYDQQTIYKVDTEDCKVTNRGPDFKYIVAMDNRTFGRPNHLVTIRLNLAI